MAENTHKKSTGASLTSQKQMHSMGQTHFGSSMTQQQQVMFLASQGPHVSMAPFRRHATVSGRMMPTMGGLNAPVCHYFLQGFCARGEQCKYSHYVDPPVSGNNSGWLRSNAPPLVTQSSLAHHANLSPLNGQMMPPRRNVSLNGLGLLDSNLASIGGPSLGLLNMSQKFTRKPFMTHECTCFLLIMYQ